MSGDDPTPGGSTTGAADAALVVAARGGDRVAFARLYERYAKVIHAVLVATGARQEAEDLTQEVFVSAMRKLSDLKDPGAFGGWIVASARNRAMSWLRNRRSAPAMRLVSEASASAPRASTGLSTDDVLEALRALPEAYRETLAMRLIEGLTGPEIAERTGMTHGSVRVNLHRGMELLRARLAEVGS